jgi:8-amino-7-oxononanoate synthase
MSASMTRWLTQQARVRASRGLERTLLPRHASEPFLDLASNDYLGLATDPRLVRAATAATEVWGTGSTSSRLVAGTTALHTELEDALAALTGAASALVYSSGYLANIGVLTALGGPGTAIVADSHCHASMIDGFRLSRSRTQTFAHNSVADAARLLSGRTEPRALIAVESIYSVLGDAAPLADLLALAVRHDAMLLVDEAHSLGVTGQGAGSVAGTALAGHPNVILTATLSKALGSQGGAVLGSQLLREHLINRSRTFLFDTALAPAAAAAALAAIEVIRREPWRAAAVHTNAAALAAGLDRVLHRAPATVDAPAGAVQSIRMPDAASAVAAMLAAREAGLRVGCFRPPSVPDGVSRLRLTARATLTPADLAWTCDLLGTIVGSPS